MTLNNSQGWNIFDTIPKDWGSGIAGSSYFISFNMGYDFEIIQFYFLFSTSILAGNRQVRIYLLMEGLYYLVSLVENYQAASTNRYYHFSQTGDHIASPDRSIYLYSWPQRLKLKNGTNHGLYLTASGLLAGDRFQDVTAFLNPFPIWD